MPGCRLALSDLLQCGSSDTRVIGKCYFILQCCYGQVAKVAPEMISATCHIQFSAVDVRILSSDVRLALSAKSKVSNAQRNNSPFGVGFRVGGGSSASQSIEAFVNGLISPCSSLRFAVARAPFSSIARPYFIIIMPMPVIIIMGAGTGTLIGATGIGVAGARYRNHAARMAKRCPAVNLFIQTSGT
jgi:hypothetical protein